MTGSETWRRLLAEALRCLDSLEGRVPAPPAWTLGGGTALMLRYAHRTSHDVDIFLSDPQLLTYLSPRLNDVSAAVARDYVEASNFLKLTREEGEVDFIVGPSLTGIEPRSEVIDGRPVATEAPIEVVTKKAFYRSERLKTRDVFDWAVVLAHEPEAGRIAAPILRGKRQALLARLDELEAGFVEAARAQLDLLPAGEPFVESAVKAVREHVRSY